MRHGDDGPDGGPWPSDTGDMPEDPSANNTRWRPRVPWRVSDIVAAVFLNVAAVFTITSAIATSDRLRQAESASGIISVLVTALVAAALVAGIARLSKLPLSTTVLVVAGATIAGVFLAALSTTGASDGDLAGLPVTVLQFAVLEGVFLATALLYSIVKFKTPFTSLGFVQTAGVRYLQGFGAWALALVGVVAWGLVVEQTGVESLQPPESAEDVLDLAGGSIFLAWLLVGALGPIAEEVFFRGFMLGGLRRRLGPWPAIVASSAVFAAFHIDPGALVPTFLLGLALGWVYLKSRSIWPSIFVHGLHNTLALVLASQADRIMEAA